MSAPVNYVVSDDGTVGVPIRPVDLIEAIANGHGATIVIPAGLSGAVAGAFLACVGDVTLEQVEGTEHGARELKRRVAAAQAQRARAGLN